jgi:endonuclease/exonuclease/phosphatase (EEP) superfamily protein YafD
MTMKKAKDWSGAVTRLLLAATTAVTAAACVAGRDVLHLRGEQPFESVEISPAGELAHAHIVTWNVHKADHPEFLDEVKALLGGLASIGGAVTLCLQEVRCDTFDRIDGSHDGCLTAHYAPSWKFPLARRSTGVLTVTNHGNPEAKSERLASPVREFGVTSPKVSLQTEISLGDGQTVQVINCHGLNFVSEEAFARQIDEIFKPLRGSDRAAVVCGDFNVWSPARLNLLTARAHEAGLSEVGTREPGASPAPRWLRGLQPINGFDPDIPLDRVFARGVDVLECYTIDDFASSDHRPVVVKVAAKGN